MININKVEIESDLEIEKEILQNLIMLFTTPLDSVPMNRSYGIDNSFVDEPVEVAKGRITMEYIRKAKRFEPRVRIKEISFVQNVGELIPKVVIDYEP